jgi:hypothetical protein
VPVPEIARVDERSPNQYEASVHAPSSYTQVNPREVYENSTAANTALPGGSPEQWLSIRDQPMR